jgi:hypothetical protein
MSDRKLVLRMQKSLKSGSGSKKKVTLPHRGVHFSFNHRIHHLVTWSFRANNRHRTFYSLYLLNWFVDNETEKAVWCCPRSIYCMMPLLSMSKRVITLWKGKENCTKVNGHRPSCCWCCIEKMVLWARRKNGYQLGTVLIPKTSSGT